MSTKYAPLRDFLRASPESVPEVTLSFEQMAMILGDSLPRSAYDHRQWWENQREHASRPQANAWMEAGYQVQRVDFTGRWVRFRRDE